MSFSLYLLRIIKGRQDSHEINFAQRVSRITKDNKFLPDWLRLIGENWAKSLNLFRTRVSFQSITKNFKFRSGCSTKMGELYFYRIDRGSKKQVSIIQDCVTRLMLQIQVAIRIIYPCSWQPRHGKMGLQNVKSPRKGKILRPESLKIRNRRRHQSFRLSLWMRQMRGVGVKRALLQINPEEPKFCRVGQTTVHDRLWSYTGFNAGRHKLLRSISVHERYMSQGMNGYEDTAIPEMLADVR